METYLTAMGILLCCIVHVTGWTYWTTLSVFFLMICMTVSRPSFSGDVKETHHGGGKSSLWDAGALPWSGSMMGGLIVAILLSSYWFIMDCTKSISETNIPSQCNINRCNFCYIIYWYHLRILLYASIVILVWVCSYLFWAKRNSNDNYDTIADEIEAFAKTCSSALFLSSRRNSGTPFINSSILFHDYCTDSLIH